MAFLGRPHVPQVVMSAASHTTYSDLCKLWDGIFGRSNLIAWLSELSFIGDSIVSQCLKIGRSCRLES